MKVLYFHAHPDSMGGAIKVLLRQSLIMQMNGYEVMLVIRNNNNDTHIPEYDCLCKANHLNYVTAQYPIATCIENIDILGCMDAYEQVKNIVESFKPDLIHSIQLNITVEYIARELGIPHLMNVYQISDGMFNINWLDVFPQYHSGDSDYYCKQWREGLGIESRCIRVPYDCGETAQNMTYNQIKNRIELINIAVFSEQKRQLEIIKFVDKCRNKGFSIHITFLGANKGIYADKCREYVERHRLYDEVTFEGLVLNVEKYLCKSDLLIHASTCESYPGVIVEAMGNRVPVLATPVAGVPELVIDGVNGFLTKGYSVDDLYEAFERYISFINENRLDDIINYAYETYITNHTYEVSYQKLDDYYHCIINNDLEGKKSFEEINRSFDKVIKFGNEINIDLYSGKIRESLWFLYHIKKLVEDKNYRTAIIWGAGNMGTVAADFCKILSLEIIGIVDKYKTGKKDGFVILKPSKETLENVDVVFLAMGDIDACAENSLFIEKTGKIRNISYFLISNNPCIQINHNMN
jgi:glycosyltransferase involved in cell wall biosynthesis